MKNKTYVGLMIGNYIKYVTHIDHRTRSALWEDGKPALALNTSIAYDLYTGLRYNGFKAVLVKLPDYEEPVNGGVNV